jgi:hypothetical protein
MESGIVEGVRIRENACRAVASLVLRERERDVDVD